MRDLNVFTVTGRLVKDVTLRYLQNGTAVGDSALATNYKFGDKDEVSFFDLTFWGKQAEFAAEHLTKGKAVGLSGRLKQERWEKDGEKRSKVVLVVNDVTFLPGNKKQENGSDNVSAETTTLETKSEEADVPF